MVPVLDGLTGNYLSIAHTHSTKQVISIHLSLALSGIEGGLPSYIAARKGAIEAGMDSEVLDKAISMAAHGRNGRSSSSSSAGAKSSGDANDGGGHHHMSNNERIDEAKDYLDRVLNNIPMVVLTDIG